MTFDEKKKHVLRCVGLGMDVFSAALVAECTENEVRMLEEDPVFNRRVRIEEALEEHRLLEKHNQAIEEATIKGNASAIQWKLEKLNPRRWGTKDSGPPIVGSMTINLIGRKPDGSEC